QGISASQAGRETPSRTSPPSPRTGRGTPVAARPVSGIVGHARAQSGQAPVRQRLRQKEDVGKSSPRADLLSLQLAVNQSLPKTVPGCPGCPLRPRPPPAPALRDPRPRPTQHTNFAWKYVRHTTSNESATQPLFLRSEAKRRITTPHRICKFI